MCAQLHLGTFDTAERAALAHDLAAVRWNGQHAQTNYAISNYEEELKHRAEVLSPHVPV